MATLSFTAIPSPNTTNLIVQSGIKSAALSWDALPDCTFEIWAGPTLNMAGAVKVGTSTVNSYFANGLTTNCYFFVRSVNEFGTFGGFCPGVLYTLQLVASADTKNTVATSISSGVGGGASSGTLSGYNTFVPVCQSTFSASNNSVVTISQLVTIRCGTKSGSGWVDVQIRTRLRNTTTNTDVPAGSKVFTVYRDAFSIVGAPNQFFNVNESFIAGFRGLLTPGHNYVLITEINRVVSNGTATLSLDYDASTTASGAASI